MAQIQKVIKEALGIQEASLRLYKVIMTMPSGLLTRQKAAIAKIMEGAEHIELTPQNQQIRKLQHELIEQHNLASQSIGEGEQRHLRIVGGKDFDNKAS